MIRLTPEALERCRTFAICEEANDVPDFMMLVKAYEQRTKGDEAVRAMFEALDNIENDDEHMPQSAWRMIQEALAKARAVGIGSD